jgi:fructosamine-3-kinase
MPVPKRLQLAELIDENITQLSQIEGGDIAESCRALTKSRRPLFVKFGDHLPPGLLRAEAAGLSALRGSGCTVPKVVACNDAMLVLEWIDRSDANSTYWEVLGRGLAAQHRVSRANYGLDTGGNFIGRTTQPNPDTNDWVAFFRDHRIGHLQRLLRDSGQLDRTAAADLDRLRGRLEQWLKLPEEQPALLHGDLWSGNTMPGPNGEPVIYDPAVYFGCREADLAMTQLFGGFPARFYIAYREAFPLVEGYPERVPLYNLYHVLNHALLFGGAFLTQAMKTVHRYLKR